VGAVVSPVVGLLGNDALAIGSVIVTALLLALAVLAAVRPWRLPLSDDAGVPVAAH
jgi:DHA1 family bicyclomycin/chloramphenicol resistance-like MFS transporter